MADKENPAGDGAKTATEEDPFAGFESSEFSAGEEVESAPPAPAKEPEDEVADDEVVDSSDEGGDTDDEGDPDDESSAKPKAKQTAQERINEVTKLRREAERRAEAAEAELQRLRQPPAPEPEAKAPPEQGKAAEDAKDGAPSPDDFDYGELDPRYIRALAGHEVRQEFQKLVDGARQDAADRSAQEEQRAAQERFKTQVAEGSKKHDDYYEKVVIGAEKGAWPLSEHMGKMLVESEIGDDIAYHLASHPEEADQVYRQTPLEQARYFGRMEAKFTAGQAAATGEGAGKPVETRTPKAPPPVTPARGSDGKFSPSASTDDFSAFEAHAKNQ